MEQFVLVPVSIYKCFMKTTVVTKTKLSTYQLEKLSEYQKDSLKKNINHELFAKVDSLVDKFIITSHNFLETQNFTIGRKHTGFSLTDFAQQLNGKNAVVPDIYFTWLDDAHITPSLI